MNANEKIAKLRRWAGIAGKILLAVQVLMVAATVAICLLVILYYLNLAPEGISVSLVPSAVFSVSSESSSISLTPDGVSGSASLTLLLVLLLVLKWSVYFAVLQIARSMMRDIAAHDTPFERIQVRRMRRIALLILIGSFINLLSIQLGEWVTALVLWFLSMVFDYGCLLQQESDETL